uniref:ALOG domain-containing protein n=1 Tax=Nelumbo nucifera TaxID=4432 RepID=A0A822XI65_NELNU|nr:TPA_asm: hypothetical protein HUJ06_021380 [Nelumbo nucifera]
MCSNSSDTSTNSGRPKFTLKSAPSSATRIPPRRARVHSAFEEHGGKPEANPFGARAVRLYLREVRELQAKARGISYEKKKRKRPQQPAQLPPPGAS